MLIKPIPSTRILFGLVATASLVACANPRADQDHGEHHPGQSADTTVPGPSGASPEQGGMMGGSMAGNHACCGMMDRNMQGMSPEMRQHHMDMMRRQCQ